ncbi:MAG: hypothetical protein RLZZ546_224, partial [Bacteroidota bacterium]
MNLYIRFAFLMFINLTFFLACERVESDAEVIIKETEEEPEVFQDTEIIGSITDEDNNAIENVSILVHNSQFRSNSEGLFFGYQTKLSRDGNLISFFKNKYFTTYVFSSSKLNDVTNLSTTLSLLSFPIKYSSNVVYELSLESDLKLIFPQNCFQRANGEAYNGQVYLYQKKANHLKVAPIKSMDGGKKILKNGDIYQMEAYSEDGHKLYISKPVNIVNSSNEKTFSYDTEKLKFIEIGQNAFIDELTIIGQGELVEATKVMGNMLYSDDTILPFDDLALQVDNEKIIINKTQSGYFSFFAEKGSNLDLIQFNNCGNNLEFKNIKLEDGKINNLGNIKFTSDKIRSLISKVYSCTGEVDVKDLVYFIVEFDKKRYPFYQKSNEERLAFYSCKEMTKIKYYSGNNNFISYVNPVSKDDRYTFDQDFICSPKTVGFLTIGEKTSYYTDKQV